MTKPLSEQVKFTQEGAGTVERLASDKLREWVSVKDFGVIGDGVTDDSDALETALHSGMPITMDAATIKISRKIAIAAPSALRILARGAVIINASAADIEAVLDIEVLPGFEHRIDGKLTINGNSKAFLGLRIWNKSAVGFPGGYADVVLNDVEVRNIRRASTAFSNGDGIIIRGGFQRVQINRPVVKGVALAAGAGVPGSVGVSGIAVFGTDTGYPIHTIINDPLIDSIYSEDAAYSHDQDGIRIFGPHATASGYRNSTAVVNGGQFRNCWGRSIKLQTDTGVVSSCNFSAYEGPTGGRSSEIDFQVGSGAVRDISCYYSGANALPTEVVSFQPSEMWESFAGVLSGAKIFTTSLLQQVVSTYPRASTQHQTVVRDVDVIGPITRLFEFRVWLNKSAALVSGCTINNAIEGLVRVVASGLAGSPYTGTVSVRDCVNLGSAVALVTDRVSGVAATAKVSDVGCVGFLSQAGFGETVTPKGGALRVAALIGEDENTGALRIASASIADGATADFEVRGYSGTTAAAIVSFGLNNQSHALLGISSAGVIKMAGGTAIEVGTTTEPATGTFRIWFSGGVLKVKNAAGSTRQCTIFFMG